MKAGISNAVVSRKGMGRIMVSRASAAPTADFTTRNISCGSASRTSNFRGCTLTSNFVGSKVTANTKIGYWLDGIKFEYPSFTAYPRRLSCTARPFIIRY